MNRWELLDTAEIPEERNELRLLKRGDEYAIRIAGTQGDLMNSRTHGSEDAMGELGCAHCRGIPAARVLIGGLGMGFTLATALKTVPEDAAITVAELVPGVLKWNQGELGEVAGTPLADRRVTVSLGDVSDHIRHATAHYDAILLDVDNGPEGLTRRQNDSLYGMPGLNAAYQALRNRGVLAVWSVTASPKFTALLKKTGFKVKEKTVRAHKGKGARHTIWLATRQA